jgi:hypothetical protein
MALRRAGHRARKEETILKCRILRVFRKLPDEQNGAAADLTKLSQTLFCRFRDIRNIQEIR